MLRVLRRRKKNGVLIGENKKLETLSDFVFNALSGMGHIQKNVIERASFFIKDRIVFSRLDGFCLIFVNKNYFPYKFSNEDITDEDKLLFAATQSYWIASGKYGGKSRRNISHLSVAAWKSLFARIVYQC